MAASVYTVAQSAVTDLFAAVVAGGAAAVLAGRWLPAWGVGLAAGGIGWLVGA
jgi:hypothetical protein